MSRSSVVVAIRSQALSVTTLMLAIGPPSPWVTASLLQPGVVVGRPARIGSARGPETGRSQWRAPGGRERLGARRGTGPAAVRPPGLTPVAPDPHPGGAWRRRRPGLVRWRSTARRGSPFAGGPFRQAPGG